LPKLGAQGNRPAIFSNRFHKAASVAGVEQDADASRVDIFAQHKIERHF